jgi:hypothetical protein
MEAYEKIEAVLTHIQNVQRNCYKLGMKLIKNGQFEIGRNLIANGQIHDNSKFKGIEFDHLFNGDPILSDVVKHHASTNPHHPEYWGDIQHMPSVYIAEMVCDCTARSGEFGSDVRNWFINDATSKYNFNMDDKIGVEIIFFLDMLLEKPFKKR